MALRDLEVATVFSVSGNQVLPFYDAARDFGVRIIHMRHESAAAFAAAGYTEMSGKPGVILTSAGPAFLAALTGVATVRTMELPLLFLSGTNPIADSGFGTFQELDQRLTCSEVCKASFLATSVESIAVHLNQAWELAQSGIPGPVHIALPADVMLRSSDAPAISPAQYRPSPSGDVRPDLDAIAVHLHQSQRPVVIGRPAAARGRAGDLLNRLSVQLGVQPVITGPPRGLADSKYAHLMPHYKRSDCALVVGPSDYSLGFLSESVIAAEGKILLIDADDDPKPRREPAVHVKAPVVEALSHLIQSTEGYPIRDREWSRLWLAPVGPEPVPASTAGPAHPLELQPQSAKYFVPTTFSSWTGANSRNG